MHSVCEGRRQSGSKPWIRRASVLDDARMLLTLSPFPWSTQSLTVVGPGHKHECRPLRLLENKEKQQELWCLLSIKKPLSSLSVYGEKRPEGIWNSCAYLPVVLKELIFWCHCPWESVENKIWSQELALCLLYLGICERRKRRRVGVLLGIEDLR